MNTSQQNDNFVNRIHKTRKLQKYFDYFVLIIVLIFTFIFFGRLWVITEVGESPFTLPVIILAIGLLIGFGKEVAGNKRDDFRIKTYYRLVDFYIVVCNMPDNKNTKRTAENTIKEYGEDEVHTWLNECEKIDRTQGRTALIKYLRSN